MRLSISIFFFLFSLVKLTELIGLDTLKLDHSLEFEDISAPFFFDPTSSLTIDQIEQYFVQGNFIAADSAKAVFDPLLGQYWLKFSIKNTQLYDHQWVLSFAEWKRVEVYETNNPNASVQTTGFIVPYKERDYPFANESLILITLRASETKTYIVKLVAGSDHTLVPSGLEFSIRTKDYQNKLNHRNELIMGIFAGVFIILFFYNLFIYLSTKDIVYLIYIGQILAIFYAINANAGYNISLLSNIEEFPKYRSLVESITGTIGPILMIIFTMHFLNTKVNLPFWHKVLKALLITMVPIAIGVIIDFSVMGPFAVLQTFILLVSFVTIGIKSIQKNIPSSGYYLAAYIFSVIGMFTLLCAISGVIPKNDFTLNYALPTGYALEMLFFSFALANKINTLEKKSNLQQEEIILHLREKELMQESINSELERKVELRTKEIRNQNILIEKERQKSDELLMNILPESAVHELKTTGSSKSKVHDNVTIMFADFQGFTQTASILPPEKLVAELNDMYQEFDDIVDRHEVEKIKTIGDAYFAVAGLFDEKKNHAHRTIQAAIEMQQYLKERNKKSEIEWKIRIGIHSGPVISGVVGKKKFAFDIWGDAVNISSRIESAGEVGQINVSAHSYNITKDSYQFIHRGKIKAKGKGEIDMYFVQF